MIFRKERLLLRFLIAATEDCPAPAPVLMVESSPGTRSSAEELWPFRISWDKSVRIINASQAIHQSHYL